MKRKSEIFAVALSVAFAAAVVLALGCPLRRVTGLPCPGCGITRAWLMVLKGDFSSAFHYHPLWALAPIMAALMVFEKKLPQKVSGAAWVALAGVFCIVYMARLFGGSEIVSFSFRQSLLYKIIYFIGGFIHVGNQP